MKEEFKKSKYYQQIAKRLINKMPQLDYIKNSNVRIGYVTSDKAKKANRKIINAECMKVKDIYKIYMPYDFLIVFYEPCMDTLTKEQEQIVIYHELKHVGIDDLKDEYYVVPHDIEDFAEILDKYGLDWCKYDSEVIFDG